MCLLFSRDEKFVSTNLCFFFFDATMLRCFFIELSNFVHARACARVCIRASADRIPISDYKNLPIQYFYFSFDKKEKTREKKIITCTNEMLLFMNIYFSKEIVKRSNSLCKLLCDITQAYRNQTYK